MSRGSRDLIIVMALAAAGLGVALRPGAPALLSAPLAVALVLALPGYALVAALDPWRETGGIELLTLRLGVSIVVTILAGLLLNLTPWGLQRQPWGLMLAGITLAAAAIALVRRRSAAPPPEPGTARAPALRLRPVQAILLALAALLLANAVNMARSGAINQPTNGFTQLWMVEAQGAAPGTVRLGVRNQEQRPQRYMLHVTDGDRILGDWPDLDLQPGAQWEITMALPADSDPATPVEAFLYRADDPTTVYRQTLLWSGTGTPGE